MRTLLKNALATVVITVLAWVAVVFYFRRTSLNINTASLINGFILVPVAANGIFFVCKGLFGIALKPVASAAKAASEPALEQIVAPVQASVPPPSSPYFIIALELETFGGEESAQLLEDIACGNLEPTLENEFRNNMGLPILAAAIESLDSDSTLEWVSAWIKQSGISLNREDGARLVELLRSPLERALDHVACLPYLASQAGTRTPPALPRIRVALFCARQWRSLLADFITHAATETEAKQLDITFDPALETAPDTDFSAYLARLAVTPNAPGNHDIILVVGCDSLCTEMEISRLEQEGRLFDTRNPYGIVPGEAAVVLALMPADSVLAELEPLAILPGVLVANRSKPVTPRNPGSETLEALCRQLLEKQGLHPADIGAVFSDSDQRPAWSAETAVFMNNAFPDLDPIADHLATGKAFGYAGHAAPILSTALAIGRAQTVEKPVISLGMGGTVTRSVMMVTPWAPPQGQESVSA